MNLLVAVSNDAKSTRDILVGILDAVKACPDWSAYLAPNPDDCARLCRLGPDFFDGVILSYPLADYSILPKRVPVIALAGSPAQFPSSLRHAFRVIANSIEFGEVAARFFLQRKFKSFAYICEDYGYGWSRIRGNAFAALLRKQGHQVPALELKSVFENGRATLASGEEEVFRFLHTLPRGTAVFCSTDRCAWRVSEYCHKSGLAIPRDLAVLGCDNDELLCGNARVPVSSIEPNFEFCGRQAVQFLERIVAKRRIPVPRVTFGVRRVVERASTAVRAVRLDARVAAAVAHIRGHLAEPMKAEDVARVMRVSVRMANTLFRKALSKSCGEVIREARVNAVKNLLLTTDATIAEICRRSGYRSEAQMKSVFKSLTGQTMLEFRRRANVLRS